MRWRSSSSGRATASCTATPAREVLDGDVDRGEVLRGVVLGASRRPAPTRRLAAALPAGQPRSRRTELEEPQRRAARRAAAPSRRASRRAMAHGCHFPPNFSGPLLLHVHVCAPIFHSRADQTLKSNYKYTHIIRHLKESPDHQSSQGDLATHAYKKSLQDEQNYISLPSRSGHDDPITTNVHRRYVKYGPRNNERLTKS
jgi:hypothetical protein